MEVTASVNGVNVFNAKSTINEIIARRDVIMGFAKQLRESVDNGDIAEVECKVTNRFAPGIYIREIFMPEDTFIIGKIHKTEHFNEVISGECRVVTPVTGKVEHYKAGDIFVSEAGVQKVVYNITDVVWRTVHTNDTNTQDMLELEDKIISPSYNGLTYDQVIENCKRALL